MVTFAKPNFGLDKSAKIAVGYTGATISESLHLIKRVIVILIPCMHLKCLSRLLILLVNS